MKLGTSVIVSIISNNKITVQSYITGIGSGIKTLACLILNPELLLQNEIK